MTSKMTKSLSVLLTGVAMAGLLVGCGTSDTSAANTGSNGSSNQNQTASNGSGNGAHRGNGNGRMNIVQMLQNAGASQADAQTLSNDIRQNHVQPQWVVQQLKNGTKAADIETEIKDGKAPKATFNRNGRKGSGGANSNGGNGSNASGSSANSGSSSDGSSTSSSGSNSTSSSN